jgi:hypothetical protein
MKTKYLPLLACLLFPIQFAVAADTNPVSTDVAGAGSFSGKVIEATNAAGYTYVQVDTGSKKLWAVTTQFPVKVGDSVVVGKGMAMGQYHSKSLNRDFDDVYFADSISVNGSGAPATSALPPGHPPIGGTATPGLPPGHPSLTTPAAAPNLNLTGIKKVEGGKTIQEIFANKAKLAGKTVSVRGKVVKYNAMILGKNWLHIQDGSGSVENHDNDLTITTSTPAAVGDTVVVTGNVSINRDFGAGYKYSVIIEDAQVTVE